MRSVNPIFAEVRQCASDAIETFLAITRLS
jgi:hypothetical protein